jgi:diguanylate cyclase (GGDEF)-like protein
MSEDVISLKKYLEADSKALADAVLEAYRSTLESAGDAAVQACPSVSSEIQHQLLTLMDVLHCAASPQSIGDSGRQASRHLSLWGARAAEYNADRAREVKEIMLVVARSAEAVGAKDQRYCSRLNDFTLRLESVAKLDDLTEIRDSLVRDAHELRLTVESMEKDGLESINDLRKELNAYQERAVAAELQASLDALTGLRNRRGIETELETRISLRQRFCIMLLDMDGFKQINDNYGHLAGDEVLKQFAAEIKSRFRECDCVGRWGGDEFIILLSGSIQAAQSYAERLKEWAFGDYSVQTGSGTTIKVPVFAAIGVAQWQAGETAKDLLARADGEMYAQKNRNSRPNR